MESVSTDIWFADGTRPFPGREPYFYDPRDFDWVGRVESKWQVIRDELMEHLHHDGDLARCWVEAGVGEGSAVELQVDFELVRGQPAEEGTAEVESVLAGPGEAVG